MGEKGNMLDGVGDGKLSGGPPFGSPAVGQEVSAKGLEQTATKGLDQPWGKGPADTDLGKHAPPSPVGQQFGPGNPPPYVPPVGQDLGPGSPPPPPGSAPPPQGWPPPVAGFVRRDDDRDDDRNDGTAAPR